MHCSGPKPKVAVDAFEDLLGGQQFTSSRREPMTIKEMRKDINVKDMDPDQLKVRNRDASALFPEQFTVKAKEALILT